MLVSNITTTFEAHNGADLVLRLMVSAFKISLVVAYCTNHVQGNMHTWLLRF